VSTGAGPTEEVAGTSTRRFSAVAGSWVAGVVLMGAIAVVYWHAGALGFVNLDDPQYVYQNDEVSHGLTLEGIGWAFTTFHASNWHPLTWISHMIDVQLFGLDPGPQHLVSVALHAVATLLLFLFLQAATGKPWRAAAVALLFAVHPLHVESVAWISERKDVLSAVFWMASCLAYVGYARHPGPRPYALVLLFFAAALLSKPMAVTLPFVLLLLDYWPLGRLALSAGALRRAGNLLLEKAPLFALAAASGTFTYLAQSRGGSVSPPSAPGGPLGLAPRIGNAFLSYVVYLAKTAWPVDLAALYPHLGLSAAGFPGWKGVGATLAIGAVTVAAVAQFRRRPYLPVGWFWYLGTLVPVVGLVQVGLQGMADRYTYVPLVGIFIALTWLAADISSVAAWRRVAVSACAIVAALALASAARRQVAYWRDSLTLFQHAVSVTEQNWLAWRNLGGAYQEIHLHGEAVACFEESLKFMPYAGETWAALAMSYGIVGRHEDAIRAFREAVGLRPDDAVAWYNFAIECAGQGRWGEVSSIEQRLRVLDPALATRLLSTLGNAR